MPNVGKRSVETNADATAEGPQVGGLFEPTTKQLDCQIHPPQKQQ